MKKKLIPAPLDGKNVTRDWIYDIFDNCEFIVGGKNFEIYSGFVSERPTNCYIYGNQVYWHIDKYACGIFVLNDAYKELIRRLTEHDMPPVVVKYDTSMKDELILLQQFFFEND